MESKFVDGLFRSPAKSMEDEPADLPPIWYAEFAIALYEYRRREGPDLDAVRQALDDARAVRKIYLGIVTDVAGVEEYSDFARCVRARLPKDRRPTREELEAAVKACVKK
jgi:hypothetical protein